MKKTNVVEVNDKDFINLTKQLIKQQLKEENPEYDGSTLVLGEDKTNASKR